MMTQITDSELNDMVHVLADKISAKSIDLSTDQLYRLNDILTAFLTDDCGASIVEDNDVETRTDKCEGDDLIDIEFEVLSAEVVQSVRVLKPGYDRNSLIIGLNNGTLATTMGMDRRAGISCITDMNTDEAVAEIVSTSVDGEYIDYI